MKIEYCEKHNLPSYVKDDGSVVHTCTVCHPELIEKHETHKRLTTYGEVVSNGGYCDEHTEKHLMKTMKIDFDVPDHAAVEFFNDCVDCGVDLDYGKNYVYSTKHESNVVVNVRKLGAKSRNDKRWYSSNIVFDSTFNLKFHGLNVRNEGNKLVVSNNEFAGYLLSNLS